MMDKNNKKLITKTLINELSKLSLLHIIKLLFVFHNITVSVYSFIFTVYSDEL